MPYVVFMAKGYGFLNRSNYLIRNLTLEIKEIKAGEVKLK
jgi:hypothetical protein